MADPFAPLPADVVCTEQYGGPQTAHVTGPLGRRSPSTSSSPGPTAAASRQWDGLGPLLPDRRVGARR